jgi:hypothetical protein
MKRLLILIAALALLVSPLEAAESLKTVVANYDGMTLGASAPVNNVKLGIGHMSITLGSGSATPVIAGDETIGLFFTGQGSYEYVSNDPVEAAVVKANLKRATSLSSTDRQGAVVFGDTFTEILYIHPGGKLPEIPTTGTISVDDKFRQFKEYFAKDTGTPLVHLYAIKKLDNPAGQLAMAQLRGGKEAAVYAYDDVLRHSETLDRVGQFYTDNKLAKGLLYRSQLSEQLINREWKTYSVQNFLLADVDLDLTASDKRDVKYTMTQTVVPQGTPRRIFRFDFFNDVIVGLADQRHWNLRSLTDAAGNALEYDHRNDQIIIATPAHVQANASTQFKLAVDGDFLIRPQGDNFWQLGVFAWFPQPELGEQYYTFHATMRVKKPFVGISPGTTIRRVVEGDYNVVETKLDKPVQFASLLAGKYYFGETVRDGLTVRVAAYGQNDQMAFKKLSNLAHQIIDYYEVFLGPFPFTEFNIIELNEFPGGQAPPGTMFITDAAFNPHEDLQNQAMSKHANHIYAHEIAHQYWGHVVKMPSGHEQWLTESFAEYSSALLINKMKGRSAYKAMMNEWKSNASAASSSSSIAMANRLAGEGAGRNRTSLVYDKGAYLLAQLHNELGDEKFLTFLKSYQKSFNFKFGTTAHVAGMLQFVTKKDFNQFFDENYWGTGMPK